LLLLLLLLLQMLLWDVMLVRMRLLHLVRIGVRRRLMSL